MAWFSQNAPQYRLDPTQPNYGFQGPMRSLSEFSGAPGDTLQLPSQRQSYDATVPGGFNPNAGGLTPTTPPRGNVPPAGQVPGGFNPNIDLTPAKGQVPPAGGGAPTGGGGNPTDRNFVMREILRVANEMKARGQYVNPSVFNDPGYWADRIIEKGGWGNFGPDRNNIDYFTGRFGMAEGDPRLGGSGGGMGMNAPLLRGADENFSYDPAKFLDSPVFEAVKNRAFNAISRANAADGTILSGKQQKDLADWFAGAGFDAVNQDFNRNLSTAEYNRNTLWGNDDRRFSRLADFTQLGQAGAAQLGGYGSQYGGATDAIAGQQSDNTTNQGNANAGAALAVGTLPRAPLQAFDARAILSPKTERERRYPWTVGR